MKSEHWVDDAACNGVTEGWFSDSEIRVNQSFYSPGREMCDSCPVAKFCRLASLGEMDGLWAYLTPNDRKNFRSHWNILDTTGTLANKGHDRAQKAWETDTDPVVAAQQWLGKTRGKAWMDWYAPALSAAEYREFYGARQSA